MQFAGWITAVSTAGKDVGTDLRRFVQGGSPRVLWLFYELTVEVKMMNYDEKRASQRIHVEVPVHVGKEKTVTRDVSWAGVYFLTDHLFAKGVELDFSLDLTYALPGKPITLGCLGEVIRVEQCEDKFGIAAKINSFKYVN